MRQTATVNMQAIALCLSEVRILTKKNDNGKYADCLKYHFLFCDDAKRSRATRAGNQTKSSEVITQTFADGAFSS